MSSTWFVSAGGKGIGLGLVSALLARPSTTVITTTRNGQPTSGLSALSTASGSKLILLPLEVSSSTDAAKAVETLRQQHGISQLDVVWANAGSIERDMSLTNVSIDSLAQIFDTNSLGPIRLFQATWPLLQKSTNPKFVITSSAVGSLALADKLTFTPPGYGASKAAVNYFARRLNTELKDLSVIALHPGLVDTDMGGEVSRKNGIPAITVEESVKGVLEVVDKATKETADQLLNYDQTTLPW